MRAARLLVVLAACSGSVTHVGAPDVTLSPSPVVFENGWVGLGETITVTVSNRSPVKAELEVTVSGPFSADATTLSLGGGASGSLVVTYLPRLAGHHVGALQVGNARAVLLGDARSPLDCPSSACVDSSFDTLSRSCSSKWKPDGTACTTPCNAGTCQSGMCAGSFATCDDSNACTVDTCNETSGCSHVPRVCPKPADPCEVAACDSQAGCGEANAPDGTACGQNLCTSNTEQVCIGGSCVARARPSGTRCGDTWVPAYFDPRYGNAVAYDDALGQLIFFGNFDTAASYAYPPFAETWAWDASGWRQILPAVASGPASGAMAYDRLRDRVVFTGSGGVAFETWEFDGVQWVHRSPAHAPRVRFGHQTYYDSNRHTVWIYGGMGMVGSDGGGYQQVALDDLWEFDGNDWTERTPQVRPPTRWWPFLAYDESRGRLVLFGGSPNNGSQTLDDTWEFDGTQWAQANPSTSPPPGAGGNTMVYDAQRQRVVLASPASFGSPGDVWEYDGTTWTDHPFTTGPGYTSEWGTITYDPIAGQVAFFCADSNDGAFSATWHWDGQLWTPSNVLPLERANASLAYDPAGGRTVMFGGDHDQTPLNDTWAYDGTGWIELATDGPSPRTLTAMVYDAAAGAIVLFGGGSYGYGTALGDTWLFDGVAWQSLQPAHSPAPRFGHAMAYDSTRHKVVLFGGQKAPYQPFGDTWEWDGTDWTQLSPSTSPSARAGARMAYDQKHQQLVLFGGAELADLSNPGSAFSLADTWTFDGLEWTERTGSSMVPDRLLQAMAYDPVRERVMMFGGFSSGGGGWTRNDTLEWDGAQWTTRSPAVAGPWVGGIETVYDAARDDFVVFGGNTGGPSWGHNQTWLYIPP